MVRFVSALTCPRPRVRPGNLDGLQPVSGSPDLAADVYNEAGRINDAHVIPAGLAFARSIAAKPELNLYVPDKRHPSMAGSYLAACVVLGSVFGVSPVGNSYTAGLDVATANHLQRVAWETVQSYHLR